MPEYMVECFPYFGNKQELMNFLKFNPHFAIQYERTIISEELDKIGTAKIKYGKITAATAAVFTKPITLTPARVKSR